MTYGGPDAIGRTIRFAIEQPKDVDVNEIVVRPPLALGSKQRMVRK